MKKYSYTILPIVLIIFSATLTYSAELENITANSAVTIDNKNYGSPIKRWAGDAKCKLKRFFGGSCST